MISNVPIHVSAMSHSSSLHSRQRLLTVDAKGFPALVPGQAYRGIDI